MLYLLLFILLLLLYLFAILPRISRQKEMVSYQHSMFAHRGYHCAGKLIPENSMAAFRAAVVHKYGIELDIHLTKDKQVVVFHDDTLKRLCGVEGSVESHTYEELKSYYLLHTSEKIPLLQEVLDYVDGRVPLLIEIKLPGHSTEICAKTWELLEHYQGRYLIQSFNTMALFWFRRYAPQVLRGQLSSNLTSENLPDPYILRFLVKHLLANFLGRPDFISYKLSDLPEPAVWFCHKVCRTPLAVWTLRTPEALEQGKETADMLIFEKETEFY